MTGDEDTQFESCFSEAKTVVERLSQSLPKSLDVAALGVRSKAPYQLLVVREALIWRTEELGRNACAALERNDLAVAAILTRAITENTALTWKLKEILDTRAGKTAEELNTVLMRALAGSKIWEDTPDPFNVLSCLDRLDKIVSGARATYDSLSEYAHPNWRGVVGLYSKTDAKNFITYFGRALQPEAPKGQIASALSAALAMFEYTYNVIADELPKFLSELESIWPESQP